MTQPELTDDGFRVTAHGRYVVRVHPYNEAVARWAIIGRRLRESEMVVER